MTTQKHYMFDTDFEYSVKVFFENDDTLTTALINDKKMQEYVECIYYKSVFDEDYCIVSLAFADLEDYCKDTYNVDSIEHLQFN